MKALVGIMICLLVTPCLLGGARLEATEQEETKRESTVLIFEGYQQIFGYSELKQAMSFLEERLEVNVEVHALEDTLNQSVLSLIDVLILPAGKRTNSLSAQERNAVKGYLQSGGGLLILGGPSKKGLRPEPLAFEGLLSNFGVTFFAHEGHGDIVHNYVEGESGLIGNGTLLSINKSNANGLTRNYFKGVDEISIQSASLDIASGENVSSITAPSFSFSISGGSILQRGEEIPLLASKKINHGRFTVLGFGQAFTNLSSPLGNPWITLKDNKLFFSNVVDWLEGEEAPEETTVPLMYVYLSVGVGIFSILIALYFKGRGAKEEKPKKKVSDVLKEIRERKKES